jgi:rhamnosyltransferase
MAVLRPTPENVCAVVVTYHPDADFVHRIALLAPQVQRIVVVDNGSTPPAIAMLNHSAAMFGVHLILNAENLGIATALNQGVEWGANQGFAWVVTLDQDSVVDADMVTGLQEIYDQMDRKKDIAVIAPNFRSLFGKYWKRLASSEDKWIEREAVITSGSLLSVSAYRAAGKFRDDFFIDMVDTEYCLRLRSKGYRIFITTKPLMTHAIGAQTRHNILWGGVNATNHSALRRYYIARNRLVLARMYLRREPRAVWGELKNMMIESIVIILCESEKKSKLTAIATGVWDAMRGRMGKKNNVFGG